MPIKFDSSALSRFSNAQLGDANAIANLSGKGLTTNGTWSLSIKILKRTELERRANNEVREEFLRSLGKAFGIGGCVETGNGRLKFSAEFMDRLSQILGRDFKRGDFGVSANGGMVTSGKPLTQRRITAILTRAERVASGEVEIKFDGAKKDAAVSLFDEPLPANVTNAKKKEIYRPYADKLDKIRKDFGVAGLTDEQLFAKVESGSPLKLVYRATKCLKFLMNELDLERVNKNGPDNSSLRDNEYWEFVRDDDPDEFLKGGQSKFEFRDPETGKFVPLNGTQDYTVKMSCFKFGGATTMHPTYSNFRSNESDSVAPLKQYMIDILTLYVKKSIDLYFEAEQKGKKAEYLKFMAEDPGACMEQKGKELMDFEKNVLFSADDMSAEDKKNAAEIERIADQSPVKGEPPKSAERFVYDEINFLVNSDKKYDSADQWKDFSEAVKKSLVGKTATIVVPDGEGRYVRKFVPLMEDGKQVVRPLTEADIDKLGPICLANVLGL